MYSKSKYIVGELGSGILPIMVAVVFPESINHTDVAPIFSEIMSAGFCQYGTDQVSVFGESIGLHIKSDPTHERLVGRAMSHPAYET